MNYQNGENCNLWPDLTDRLDYHFNFETDDSSLSADALLESLVVDSQSDSCTSHHTSEYGDVAGDVGAGFGDFAVDGVAGFDEFAVNAVKFESADEFEARSSDGGCSSGSEAPTATFKFVDESEQFLKKRKPETENSDVEQVRSRLKRRSNRPAKAGSANGEDSRRMRNTMAARRYRERQRKDVEVLDARIRQMEEELRNAKVEIMWWKMESTRWKEEAQRKSLPADSI